MTFGDATQADNSAAYSCSRGFYASPAGRSRPTAECLKRSKLITKVIPVYPELSKKMAIRGTVRVQAIIAPNGTVKSTKIMGGHPVLAQAAVNAVSKWKFGTAAQESTS